MFHLFVKNKNNKNISEEGVLHASQHPFIKRIYAFKIFFKTFGNFEIWNVNASTFDCYLIALNTGYIYSVWDMATGKHINGHFNIT
jgi:hypothetical protein